jgi:PAT family beta-lactamase induction signal transducer AmpG
MALGLAMQTNLAVELGFSDDKIAALSLTASVLNAIFMVVGGLLSDKLGRRRTLGTYLALMSLPTLFLAWKLQQYGWILPAGEAAAKGRIVPPELITALWVSVCAYSAALGLMYGARAAIFMDVTNPLVAATQFTAYMALLNLAIAYSAVWQGIASEAFGYPKMLLIDALIGPLCVLLLPWMRNPLGNSPDGVAPRRARLAATVLGVLCILWLPYRWLPGATGAAQPIVETAFTVVFVAAALFLLAGSVLLRGGVAARIGGWLGVLLLAMYARRWLGDAGAAAEFAIRAVPVVAGVVLLSLSRASWQALNAPREASPP